MTKYWGPITWILIHSIYAKVSQQQFNSLYLEINNVIKKMISLLPCDECKNHAITYLKNNKFNINERNIEKQRSFFYIFHNDVNRRLHKPQFRDFGKYNGANLNAILHNFSIIFPQNTGNRNSLTNSFHRRLIVKNISSIINKIQQ